MELITIGLIVAAIGSTMVSLIDAQKYFKTKKENSDIDMAWTSLCIKLEKCENVTINDDNSILLAIKGIEYIYLQIGNNVYLNNNTFNVYICDILDVNEYFEGVFTGDYTLLNEVHKHKQAIEELKYGYNGYEYYRGLNSVLNLKDSKYSNVSVSYKDFVVILDNHNHNCKELKVFKRYSNNNKFINAEYRIEHTHTIPYIPTDTKRLRNILTLK
jgi:hypothetical protein